jgi:hypothetical protein
MTDLCSDLSLREQHMIYVCDTHKPTHLRNLFGTSQVIVLDDGLMKMTSLAAIEAAFNDLEVSHYVDKYIHYLIYELVS